MNLRYLNKLMEHTSEYEGFGHWRLLEHLSKTKPEDVFGFVYCIENTKTGKLYLGRKQTTHQGKKSSKTYGKPTNWKSYSGSSKHLTADLKSFGKDVFNFHILEFYKTRGGLNAAEIEWQIKCDALTARFPDSDERIFLNGQVSALRWVPKEFFTDSSRKALFDDEPSGNYGYVGTCVKTGETIVLSGAKVTKDAGFSESRILNVINGNCKTHKGYTWKKG